MSFVTFITPTLNRPSLKKTLTSLLNQLDSDWSSIVIGDGCKPTHHIEDKRIFYMGTEKVAGGAGVVRNQVLKIATSQSDWVAFVDDDDFLDRTYVSEIRKLSNDYDLIQFTYKDIENGNTQPPPNLNHLVSCNFGISFAVRSSLVEKFNIKFITGGVEDYQFLQDCLDAGARYIITHKILYFVGHRSAWAGG